VSLGGLEETVSTNVGVLTNIVRVMVSATQEVAASSAGLVQPASMVSFKYDIQFVFIYVCTSQLCVCASALVFLKKKLLFAVT
jgi:hypothetical protein